MYGKIIGTNFIYAPENYLKSDGSIIVNFNVNIKMMKQYGFEEVVEYKPDYDSQTQEIYISNMQEQDGYIYLTYSVRPISSTTGDMVFNVADIIDDNSSNGTSTYSSKHINYLLSNLKIVSDDNSFKIVQTKNERDKVSPGKNGFLCYVIDDDKYYQYLNEEWVEFNIDDSNKMVYFVSDSSKLDSIKQNINFRYGSMCYVETEDCYYYYSKQYGWTNNRNYVVQDQQPVDKNVIWFDKTVDLPSVSSISNREVLASIKVLNAQIEVLNNKVAQLQQEIKDIGNSTFSDSSGNVKNGILLENGGSLLLENGGYLLLEQ